MLAVRDSCGRTHASTHETAFVLRVCVHGRDLARIRK
jgi:hypothetical protein